MCVARLELAQANALQDWYDIARLILQTVELHIGGMTHRGIPAILKASDSSDARTRLAVVSSSGMKHPGALNAIKSYLETSLEFTLKGQFLKSYLMGEKIGVQHFAEAGVKGIKNPLSKKNAEHFLSTVLRCLEIIGIPGMVLLFDEADQLFSSSTTAGRTKVRRAANVMRRMVDGLLQGRIQRVFAVFAVLPDFLSICGQAYPALQERVVLANLGRPAPSWRCPVHPLSATNRFGTRRDFSRAAVAKFMSFCDGNIPSDQAQVLLKARAEDVYSRFTGPEFRRMLVRELAKDTLRLIGK